MAQAVTFRAFGAENPSFDTTSVARVISIQSRFAEVEKTFAAKPSQAILARRELVRLRYCLFTASDKLRRASGDRNCFVQ